MKEITLDQLMRQNSTKPIDFSKNRPQEADNVTVKPATKEVSISDVAKALPGKPQEETKQPPIVENALNSMYNRIEESKKFINEEVVPVIQRNAEEIAMEIEEAKLEGKDISDITDIPVKVDEDNSEIDVEESTYETPDVENIDFESSNEDKSKLVKFEKQEIATGSLDDIGDLEEMLNEIENDEDELTVTETDTEETIEERNNRYKESLSGIKVISDPIDLSKFKVRNKPISASAVLNTINNRKTVKEADWVLYSTGRSFRVSECSGPELDTLGRNLDNGNNLNAVIESLKFVYNHIVDANKPSFENWCKSVKAEDIDSLYFSIYKACYGSSNYINRPCSSGCNKISIFNIPIEDMVKYKDDETKAKFNKILNTDTTTSSEVIKSELLVISDDIVIAYTEPTLYSAFVEYASLNPDISRKYGQFLDTLRYINGFFKIDKETNELVPIEVKVYPNNLNKTVLTKIKVYIDVLKTLTNDQYNILVSKLNKLNNFMEDSAVKYVYPKLECPECGKTIPEENIDSTLSLLFIRAQLVSLRNL